MRMPRVPGKDLPGNDQPLHGGLRIDAAKPRRASLPVCRVHGGCGLARRAGAGRKSARHLSKWRKLKGGEDFIVERFSVFGLAMVQ